MGVFDQGHEAKPGLAANSAEIDMSAARDAEVVMLAHSTPLPALSPDRRDRVSAAQPGDDARRGHCGAVSEPLGRVTLDFERNACRIVSALRPRFVLQRYEL